MERREEDLVPEQKKDEPEHSRLTRWKMIVDLLEVTTRYGHNGGIAWMEGGYGPGAKIITSVESADDSNIISRIIGLCAKHGRASEGMSMALTVENISAGEAKLALIAGVRVLHVSHTCGGMGTQILQKRGIIKREDFNYRGGE